MSPVGDTLQTASNIAPIAMAKVRASQKVKSASGLHAESGDTAGAGTSSFKYRRSDALYQSGTDQGVPFRYGLEAPRLNAAFVAQLLGQMMPDRAQRNSSALAVYEDMPATARFCDRQL
jgi:hypothetical protein